MVSAESKVGPHFEFRVLGPLEVMRDGHPVPIPAAKQRIVLAALLRRPGRILPVDELISRLWDDAPPGGARGTLRAYIMRLRQALSPDGGQAAPIRTHPEGYLIDVDPEQIDLHRFDALVAEADRAADTNDPAAEVDALRRALALWRGPVLSNVPSDSLHREVVPGLAERRPRALERRIDLDLRLGRSSDVISELRGLTAQYPLRERFWAQLMLALYRDDRQAEALETYERLRGHLRDELGADPGENLRELHSAILRQDVALAPTPAAGTPALTDTEPEPEPPAWERPFQLPPNLPDFVGRDDTARRVAATIAPPGEEATGARFAVLSGSPGVGKTALAVRVAHRVGGRFPDGHLHIDLRGYDLGAALHPQHVLARFLRALGVPREQLPVEQDEQVALYRTLLADRRVLVVLDNAVNAEQVRPLLPGGAGCAVLVTSRTDLRGLVLHGARLFPLDALGHEEAIDLLTEILGEERARREPEAVDELARLCAHIPLALRVAAANLAGGRGVAEYVAELREGDRLAGLAIDGDPDAAVRGAFDHSYTALTPAERRVFRLLGLVPGPDHTAEAAAALAAVPVAEVRDVLDRLAAMHLVQRPTPGRYQFHDLMREYAVERATEECEARERSAALRRLFEHYLARTDAAAALLHPDLVRLPRPRPVEPPFTDADTAAGWLDAERANLLAAVEHAVDHDLPEFTWHLADALRPYFFIRSLITDWLTASGTARQAASAQGERGAEAAMLHSLGNAWWNAGRFPDSLHHLEQALAAFRDSGQPQGEIRVLNSLAPLKLWSGRADEAVELFSRALRLSQEQGLRHQEITVQGNLGAAYESLDLRRAAEHLRQSLALSRTSGTRNQLAMTLGNLASIAMHAGDFDDAAHYADEALAMLRELGARSQEVPVLTDLARLHRERGELEPAAENGWAALRQGQEIGNQRMEVEALVVVGSVLRLRGDRDGVEYCESAVRLAREIGYRNGEVMALLEIAEAHRATRQLERARERAERALELSAGAHRVLEGHSRTLRARIAHEAGDTPTAAEGARAALETHRASGARPGEARTLSLLGTIALATDGPEAALPHWRAAHTAFAEMAMPEAAETEATIHAHTNGSPSPR